jgi:hypothetical protein
MIGNCDHSGFHSGVGKLASGLDSIRFVLVCDGCGEEVRVVQVEEYAPQYDPEGTGAGQSQRAA